MNKGKGLTDFAGLYQTTVAPLRRYLARILGNHSEADDVAHDAYLRVYRYAEKNPTQNPEALLYVTARRLAINELRRRKIAPIGTEPLAPESVSAAQPGVTDEVMARQELARVQQAIDRLPAGCRQVLLLRKIELLSHRDIAERLGIAVSTVEKQHARALRLLRAMLAEEAVALSAQRQEANS
ncbi:MAG TPA: sigma-70 family RNA polymerase sigma factor [Opitutaceae bacterium]|nr:sigma-70 family RNA polymerase sigma factor [Opitutaceae bacterium]HRJ46581.1 sigma-70 family RNA polymerase sigma factor [Opitutaceae bacterium]